MELSEEKHGAAWVGDRVVSVAVLQ